MCAAEMADAVRLGSLSHILLHDSMGKRRKKKFSRSNTVTGNKTKYVAADEPVILHYDKGCAWLLGQNGRLVSDGPYGFTRTYKGER